MSNRVRLLLTTLMILALVLGACGRGGGDEAPPQEEAPLAQEEAPLADEAEAEPTEPPAEEAAPAEEEATEEEEAPAEEEAAEAEPTEEPAEEAAEESAEAGAMTGVQEAFDAYLSTIPEGWMVTGQIDAVNELIDAGAVLIDVREESEYAEGHIPGAVNVPIRTLTQNLDKIPAEGPVLIYCASGHRAGMALSSLQALGYDNTRSFPGGWRAWSEAGEEVSTEATEGETYEVPAIEPELLAAVDGFLSTIPDGFLVVRSVEDLEAAQDAGATVVDVRQPDEFERGHISGAINIPLRELGQNLDQIPADAPVIVYCASGHRAALATAALQGMGYSNVRSFPAGYGAWEAAQVEGGEVPAEVEAAVESEGVVAGVDAFLSSIPEGFLATGNMDAFKDMMENTDVYLVDVREVSEYEEGHIPGAVNIPIRTLADNLDQIPTDQPVMIYCASGHRAGMATAALQALGYSNVKAYPPGWKGWSAAEEEVSTEATEPGSFEAPEVDAEMLAAVADFLSNIPEGFYAVGSIEGLEGAIDAGATVIDVREVSEFENGAIPGAINIPIRELAQNLDQIPTDGPVMVYCASGFRAAMATAALHSMGFDNVRSYPPGYGGWEAAQ